MKRRAKGALRLTNEELQALQPQDLMEIHNEIPEMGTVTIRADRTDLNCVQVYRVYKQRQAIEQFFRTYGASLDFEASYMRTQATHGSMAVSQSPLVHDGNGLHYRYRRNE